MSSTESAGSEKGFLSLEDIQSLFSEVRGDILRFVQRRTRNPESAADLTQDLFLKLSAVPNSLPSRKEARAYLFRMAGNLAIDHVRVEARRSEILDGSKVLFEDTTIGPEAIAISRDHLRVISDALDELPPKCREVLVLARVHGLEHREIAQRLGVSISLVEKYQLRALRHCRDRLALHR